MNDLVGLRWEPVAGELRVIAEGLLRHFEQVLERLKIQIPRDRFDRLGDTVIARDEGWVHGAHRGPSTGVVATHSR